MTLDAPITPAPQAPQRPSLPARAGIVAVRFYQVSLGWLLGGRCRFHPTCSHYAIEALEEWGLLRGSWLAIRRLARCHPLGGHGVDMVPRRRPRPPANA